MRKKRNISQSMGGPDENMLNLTPLIDVVFVVLILFIIVAPMLELDRIELAKAAGHPDKEMAVTQENSPITIHVHEDNSIWLNSKKVSEGQLLPLLKEAKRHNPLRIPQLYHDKKAHFGTYQTVKNALELAGFEQLDVILQPG
jgi:biopolymer transport protein ExbD